MHTLAPVMRYLFDNIALSSPRIRFLKILSALDARVPQAQTFAGIAQLESLSAKSTRAALLEYASVW